MKKLLTIALVLTLGLSMFFISGCETAEAKAPGTLTPSATSVTGVVLNATEETAFASLTFTYANAGDDGMYVWENGEKVFKKFEPFSGKTFSECVRNYGMSVKGFDSSREGTRTATFTIYKYGVSCKVTYTVGSAA